MKCLPYHETKQQEFVRIYDAAVNSKKLSEDENVKLYSLGSYGAFGNNTNGKPWWGLDKKKHEAW